MINVGRDDVETNVITHDKKAKGTLQVTLLFENPNNPQMAFPVNLNL